MGEVLLPRCGLNPLPSLWLCLQLLLLPVPGYGYGSDANEIGCWHGPYTYERCCLQVEPGCWDYLNTPERCCRSAGDRPVQRTTRGVRLKDAWAIEKLGLAGAAWARSLLYLDASADQTRKERDNADIRLEFQRGQAAKLQTIGDFGLLDGADELACGEEAYSAATLNSEPAAGASWVEVASTANVSWDSLMRGSRGSPEELQQGCPPTRFFRPLATRDDLGAELMRQGLHGIGVEVGAQDGTYTRSLLEGWRHANLFVQIDRWVHSGAEGYKDFANSNHALQMQHMFQACRIGRAVVRQGWAGAVVQCRGDRLECARHFVDNSLDFVYLDARHDRGSVLQELQAYWPKLRPGGVMAGHDYTEQDDPDASQDPQATGQDWTLNHADGTREISGRAVRGAVDDFFSGVARESPPELRRCPRQPVITYRELKFNTWAVIK
eukprot:gnl/TRDRNA2_/TRDRNA2_129810_c0_seq1.p1 gnl/TRDRNA2_/TRDRNA2_129810_c0~~gnl/TRDRNA2_/TRDRNA2_129810_c0_seq1.p1  ORF type:complete len:449 (+),score=50.60 gnl/TRDRNA2_/TRDRNA2_129810_c0_seq1:36-1349(+)